MDSVEQGFNYHGITIITPEIAGRILQAGKTFLKGNESEQAEYFIGDEWDTLK